MPESVQDALDSIDPIARSTRSGFFTDALNQQYLDWITENHDVEVYTLPTEERERWREAYSPCMKIGLKEQKNKV